MFIIPFASQHKFNTGRPDLTGRCSDVSLRKRILKMLYQTQVFLKLSASSWNLAKYQSWMQLGCSVSASVFVFYTHTSTHWKRCKASSIEGVCNNNCASWLVLPAMWTNSLAILPVGLKNQILHMHTCWAAEHTQSDNTSLRIILLNSTISIIYRPYCVCIFYNPSIHQTHRNPQLSLLCLWWLSFIFKVMNYFWKISLTPFRTRDINKKE